MDKLILAKPSATEVRLIKFFMQIAFRPVFGWKDRETYDIEKYQVTGLDNSSLSVVLRRAQTSVPKGVVVLCHPFIKYGMSWFLRSRYQDWLSTSGYHVIAFDFKGFGRSSLGGISFGDDLSTIVGWTQNQFPGLPIHLFGVSFGGYHAIHSLARHHLQITCAIFDSVPMDLRHFFQKGWLGLMMRWFGASRFGPITGTNPVLDSLPNIGALPCLFLYGRKDRYILAEELARLSALRPAAKLLFFENCGHIELKKHQSAVYTETTLSFFDDHSKAEQ